MSGVELITEERYRQIEQEGFGVVHDSQWIYFQLGKAAFCYLAFAIQQRSFVFIGHTFDILKRWPFDLKWWKPSDDPIRNLVKAGALIAAEIDRLQARR
jgi:hypothetical protein